MSSSEIKYGCIYLITCLENGKLYVGQYNKPNPKGRYTRHWAPNQRDTCVLHRAMWKHGKNAFKLETLCIVPHESLGNMEAYYAEELRTYTWDTNEETGFPGGYNMIECGGFTRTGIKHSPETIAKCTAASTGRKHSEETRAKIGASQKGKKISPEAIEKQRQSLIGFKHSDETRAKMSASGKGKKRSDEARSNMSAAQKGKKFSDEARANMSIARKGIKLTPEQLARRRGLPQTEKQIEQRKKIHEANKGRKQSPEAIEKMRIAKKEWWAKKKQEETSV